MCGIFGSIEQAFTGAFAGRSARTAELLRHRGPDDHGFLIHEAGLHTVGLGQTRLSIIDLSEGGHQPMVSADGRLVLILNGEIYNYRELRSELEAVGCVFRSSSDTEVLLQAWTIWGEKCLNSLVGMYAFAVLDQHDNTLTIVRDAFGIKPLYFYASSTSFAFASEISALESLLNHRLGLNQESMLTYLAFGTYDLGSDTFFKDVHRLEAGHLLRLDLDERTINPDVMRWWWPSVAEKAIDFFDAAEMVRECFLENVRLHLRSDVPLGVALSGGVDSSSIACALHYLEPEIPIQTFSFVAPGTTFDEEPWIDRVNAAIGGRQHKVFVEPMDLARDLDAMIIAQGEPFVSSSLYAQFRVYQSARDAGVTVMLDGQGADELFAGYSVYLEARLRSLLSRGDLVGTARLLRHWTQYPGRSGKLAFQAVESAASPPQLRRLVRRVLGRGFTSEFFVSDAIRDLQRKGNSDQRPLADDPAGRALVAQLRRSLTEGSMNRLLRHGDRNSMHWSIESRVPFLTVPMANLTLSLPESFLLGSTGETKKILRTALGGIVPKSVLYRRDKVGFATPERAWVRALGPLLHESLDGLRRIPGVNADAARTYVIDCIDGQRPYSEQIWRLVNAGRWVQLIDL